MPVGARDKSAQRRRTNSRRSRRSKQRTFYAYYITGDSGAVYSEDNDDHSCEIRTLLTSLVGGGAIILNFMNL